MRHGCKTSQHKVPGVSCSFVLFRLCFMFSLEKDFSQTNALILTVEAAKAGREEKGGKLCIRIA